jgi:hypothetical protein
MVVDRSGGKPGFDVFSESELRGFYTDQPEGWADRVIDAIIADGHYDDGDEDFLILFFDADALPH